MGLAAGYDAWIISVGNELLIGSVVNSNMAWLGRRLTYLGFRVRGGLVVPDVVEDIAWAFRTAAERGARVVVSTGGLGPTFDDKTAEGLARAMGVPLRLNREALEMIREKYGEKGLPLTEHRVKMAMLPEGSTPIPNPVGTAPGVQARLLNSLVFLLPGVPSEMKAMFEGYVEPLLRKVGPKLYFVERRLTSRGLPESEAAPLIDEVLRRHPKVYVKSHPRGAELGVPILVLHITASGPSEEEARREVESAVKELARMLASKGAAVSVNP